MATEPTTPSMATADPGGRDDYIFNRLLKERIIWLGSEVRDDNANVICSQLLLLSAEDPERDIFLYINSPGGSVTAGMPRFRGLYADVVAALERQYDAFERAEDAGSSLLAPDQPMPTGEEIGQQFEQFLAGLDPEGDSDDAPPGAGGR